MSFVLLLSVLIVKVGDVFVSRASRMSLRGLNEKCLVSRVARALDSLSDWSRSPRAMVSAILLSYLSSESLYDAARLLASLVGGSTCGFSPALMGLHIRKVEE